MDNVLGLAFVVLVLLFTTWNVTGLWRYLRYRRVRPAAELTWRPPRPWFFQMSLAIGVLMLTLTGLSWFVLRRPPLATVAQGTMALYYLVIFPLVTSIQRGFYRPGIWFDRGFVTYDRIRRIDWRDRPAIVLVATKEPDWLGHSHASLRVPPESYAEARRVLTGHIEDRSLTLETSVLGLAEGDVPAEERV